MADEKGLYQIMWFVDIEHLKYATVPPMMILSQIAHVLQHFYPERLYKAYILFAPWVFRMIWKMVSGLMTENTKGKIIVPGWEESMDYKTFEDEVAKENLPKRFGGDSDLEYSYEYELANFGKESEPNVNKESEVDAAKESEANAQQESDDLEELE